MYLFKWRKQANQSVAIFTELNIGLLLIWWHFAKNWFRAAGTEM